MPTESSWQISEPQTLEFDGHIDELHVHLVGGAVNVVGTQEPGARIEVDELEGPPLRVHRKGRALHVTYDGLPWHGFLKWLDRKAWARSAVVSVSVPATVRLSVKVVGASAVVSGITGHADVRSVSGDSTLVAMAGPVRAETVSGSVETQGLGGRLRFNTVSGDLTVVDGAGSGIKADSVSGDMILDLGDGRASMGPDGTDVALTSVSGEVAVRLPEQADVTVEASAAGGTVSSAFDELKVEGMRGAYNASGTLGTGLGRLRAQTVSGAIALLRRPDGLDRLDSRDSLDDAPSLVKDL